MPDMAPYFSVKEETIQLTVAANLFGASISGLLSGALSDYLGRRPLMITGMVIFIAASFFCAVSPTIHCLFLARFLQGWGVGVFNVVGVATIQDLYTPKQSAKVMARMETAFTVLPTLTPIIGGHLHVLFGWRVNFLAIFFLSALILAGVFAFFKESNHQKKKNVSLKPILNSYKELFKNKTYFSYIILSPILYCAEICMFTVLPFYFIGTLHIAPDHFGYYLGVIIGSYGVACLITPSLIERLGLDKTILCGLIIVGLSSLCQLWVSLMHPGSSFAITFLLAFHEAGMAILYAPSICKSLELFSKSRGVASALPNTLFMIAAALGAFIAGSVESNSLAIGAVALIFASFLTIFIFLNTYLKLKPTNTVLERA
jgi:DHA1 family bicyclomycin/chloramphenicol resistance-like MFS transporter